jgi:hypothetical protein
MNNLKVTSKLMLFLIASVLLIGLVSATDVIYIVTNPTEDAFTNALDDLGLSYDVVNQQDLYGINFDDYGMILINNDYFVNKHLIPINDKPAMVASSFHIDYWGWGVRTSLISSNEPLHVGIDDTHEIAGDLPDDIQVYSIAKPDYYYLDKRDIYDGFVPIAYSTVDNEDIAVGVIEEGTVLTKTGYSDTYVNANSVYFGMTDTVYWTEDTTQLFKNSLMWLMNLEEIDFDLNLQEGRNLVSFPLSLSSNDVSEIFAGYPIVSVKEFNGTEIVETDTVENHKGYFVETSASTTVSLRGFEFRDDPEVELEEGMAMVGMVDLDGMDLDDLPNKIIEVAKRNNDGSYVIATKYADVWFNGFELIAGKGYWFKLNDDVTWSYTL